MEAAALERAHAVVCERSRVPVRHRRADVAERHIAEAGGKRQHLDAALIGDPPQRSVRLGAGLSREAHGLSGHEPLERPEAEEPSPARHRSVRNVRLSSPVCMASLRSSCCGTNLPPTTSACRWSVSVLCPTVAEVTRRRAQTQDGVTDLECSLCARSNSHATACCAIASASTQQRGCRTPKAPRGGHPLGAVPASLGPTAASRTRKEPWVRGPSRRKPKSSIDSGTRQPPVAASPRRPCAL